MIARGAGAELVEAGAMPAVDQGRIAQIGTHDALLRGCLPYNQLWSQQARVYQ
jgi:ABC-type transport system involved in Fe-S cluster assembly fused permease/ATPase subunit